jgi:hypothetical protein
VVYCVELALRVKVQGFGIRMRDDAQTARAEPAARCLTLASPFLLCPPKAGI